MANAMMFGTFSFYIKGQKLGIAARTRLEFLPGGEAQIEVTAVVPLPGSERAQGYLDSLQEVHRAFTFGTTIEVACDPVLYSRVCLFEAKATEYYLESEDGTRTPLRRGLNPSPQQSKSADMSDAKIETLSFENDENKGTVKMRMTFRGKVRMSPTQWKPPGVTPQTRASA